MNTPYNLKTHTHIAQTQEKTRSPGKGEVRRKNSTSWEHRTKDRSISALALGKGF